MENNNEKIRALFGLFPGTRMDRFFNQKSLQPLFDGIKDRTLLEPIQAKFGKRKIIGYNGLD